MISYNSVFFHFTIKRIFLSLSHFCISQTGFLPGCELVFKTLSTDGRDYHSEINSVVFNKWVEEQLVPALPPKSLLVMDNVSYHSVIKEGTKAPTSGMLYGGYQPKFRPSKQCYILHFFFV
jgi:hypothetical protein